MAVLSLYMGLVCTNTCGDATLSFGNQARRIPKGLEQPIIHPAQDKIVPAAATAAAGVLGRKGRQRPEAATDALDV